MNNIDQVKSYFRLFLKKMVRIALYVTDFIPAQNNKILFFAGTRGYTCSPKYICEYLNKEYPGKFQLCWIGNDKKQINDLPYLKFIKYNSLDMLYAMITARVYVTNGTNAVCPKSKKRLILCTWHGFPYKKMGYDTTEKFQVIDAENSAMDICLSASETFSRDCVKSGYHFEGKILNCGFPRNDIFFNQVQREEAARRVRNHYGLDGLVVLFAPTYRGEYNFSKKIDTLIDFERLEETLKRRFGNNVHIIIRMHYYDKNQYSILSNVTDVGDWYDMQDILCATDILITDYSSSMWDFALTERPCFLFTPDLEQYNRTRGLYTEPQTWPGILCKNMDELCKAILDLDEKAYVHKINKYLKDNGSYEKGNATTISCHEIVKFLNFNTNK